VDLPIHAEQMKGPFFNLPKSNYITININKLIHTKRCRVKIKDIQIDYFFLSVSFDQTLLVGKGFERENPFPLPKGGRGVVSLQRKV